MDKIINEHIPIAVKKRGSKAWKKLHQVAGYLALSAVVGECVG